MKVGREFKVMFGVGLGDYIRAVSVILFWIGFFFSIWKLFGFLYCFEFRREIKVGFESIKIIFFLLSSSWLGEWGIVLFFKRVKVC